MSFPCAAKKKPPTLAVKGLFRVKCLRMRFPRRDHNDNEFVPVKFLGMLRSKSFNVTGPKLQIGTLMSPAYCP